MTNGGPAKMSKGGVGSASLTGLIPSLPLSLLKKILPFDFPLAQGFLGNQFQDAVGMADGGDAQGGMGPAISVPQGVSGFLNSDTAGRTDRLPMKVAPGSFVFPADVVSGLGQGNSLAGAKILAEILGMNEPEGFARGGMPKAPVDIIAAGGEFIAPPHVVQKIGKGSVNMGHKHLSEMVKRVRASTVSRLKKLPPPKK